MTASLPSSSTVALNEFRLSARPCLPQVSFQPRRVSPLPQGHQAGVRLWRCVGPLPRRREAVRSGHRIVRCAFPGPLSNTKTNASSTSLGLHVMSLSSPPSLLRASLRSMAAARHSLAVQSPQPRPRRRQQRRPREEAQLRAEQRAAAAALAAEPSRQAVAAVELHQA